MTKPVLKLPRRPGTTAPDSLSERESEFYEHIIDEFDIQDAAGLRILEGTAKHWGIWSAGLAVLDREGMTILGPQGRPVQHPMIAVVHHAWFAVLAGFKALNLNLEPLRDGPGRPPDYRRM